MTETSATEELRRLLDERGVEWRAYTDLTRGAMELFHSTYFETPNGCMARVTSTSDSDLVLATFRTTPEQAIAATLGSGTCSMEYGDAVTEDTKRVLDVYFCSECGSPTYNDCMPYYCIYCGKAVKRG